MPSRPSIGKLIYANPPLSIQASTSAELASDSVTLAFREHRSTSLRESLRHSLCKGDAKTLHIALSDRDPDELLELLASAANDPTKYEQESAPYQPIKKPEAPSGEADFIASSSGSQT